MNTRVNTGKRDVGLRRARNRVIIWSICEMRA